MNKSSYYITEFWSETMCSYGLKHLHIIKEALDKFNIIPNFFLKKVGIFIPLEVLAWSVKTACQVLRSRLTYFWRNMNISGIFKVNFNKYTIQ